MGRLRKPIPRDILDIAREQLPGADPCAVFDLLFDAALREIRHANPTHPRRAGMLNAALDRIYVELTEPSQAESSSLPLSPTVRRTGPQPVLKP